MEQCVQFLIYWWDDWLINMIYKTLIFYLNNSKRHCVSQAPNSLSMRVTFIVVKHEIFTGMYTLLVAMKIYIHLIVASFHALALSAGMGKARQLYKKTNKQTKNHLKWNHVVSGIRCLTERVFRACLLHRSWTHLPKGPEISSLNMTAIYRRCPYVHGRQGIVLLISTY